MQQMWLESSSERWITADRWSKTVPCMYVCMYVCMYDTDNVIALCKQEVKVIWQKAPHGGPIPRLGVTPGGSKFVPLNSWGRVSY